MLTADKFESHAAQLAELGVPDETRRRLAADVRDAMEAVHSQDYDGFLRHFLPVFVKVLTEITKPQLEDNNIHKTRAIILEVMHRLPHNEVLKNHCQKLLSLAMNVMRTDNEENSVTAIHIVFDLHKTFRPHLENQVEAFLSFVRQLYSSLPKTVDDVLRNPNAQLHRPRILKATQSFKVITECPLVVMFVFQLYQSCVRTNITALLPLMLNAIRIKVETGPENAVTKSLYKEFIAAQVKTVTFLVYLLKQVPKLMNLDEMWIPQSVVQLLKACPGEAFTIRKELLVATRHMLSSPFRKGFFSRIDALLDERVIAGTGRASTDTLRPLGYAFLAELIHGLRYELKQPQLSRIISMFSTNLHDPGFSFALQTSAARLLLNLVQAIMNIFGNPKPRDPQARELLVRIMKTMVAKYATIGDQVPRLVKSAREAQAKTCSLESRSPLSEQPVGDPLKEINDCKTLLKTLTLGLKTVVWSVITYGVVSKRAPVVPDNVAGFPKGATGVKTEAPTPAPGKGRKSGTGAESDSSIMLVLLEEESELLTQLLPSSQKCFKLYSRIDIHSEKPSNSGDSRHDRKSSPSGEKEIVEQFAQIFTILNIQSFQDIFGLRMGELLEYIIENPAGIAIAQQFLANANISKYFADILLNFAVTKMELLGVERPKPNTEQTLEQKRAYTLLRLFKSLFASVPTFSMNEPVLRLHVGTIVRECLTLSSKCEDPYNYLHLLRALFKSLTSGGSKHDIQFDSLFRDFVPLVEPLLSGLLKLYNGPHRLVHKDLLVELCLIIPARPSTLFPHLGLQIKPMVWALTGSNDNISYGLRALEFWLELLQPAYFDKLLLTVEPDLTHALQSHLRLPASNPFATSSLRILGKLGSRSRIYSSIVQSPSSRPYSDPALQFQLGWSSSNGATFHLNADDLGRRALDVLLSESRDSKTVYGTSQKQTAWEFCRFCLAPYLGLQSKLNEAYRLPEGDSWDVFAGSFSQDLKGGMDRLKVQLPISEEARRSSGSQPRTRALYEAEVATMRNLIVAIICSASLEDFESTDSSNAIPGKSSTNSSPKNFALGLSRYFALLLAHQGSKTTAADALSVNDEAKGFAAPTVIEPSIFLNALVESMSRERQEHREAGLLSLQYFIDSLMFFSGYRHLAGEGKKKESPLANKVEVEISTTDNVDKVSRSSGDGAPVETVKQEDIEMAETGDKKISSSLLKSSSETGDILSQWTVPYAINSIIEKFSHCCYERSWHSKWAGAAGLGAIISRVTSKVFNTRESPAYEAHVVRALMFVVRDLTDDVSYLTTKVAKAALEQLIRTCHEPSSFGTPAMKQKCLRDVSMCLAVELVSDSKSARSVSKEAFRTLANVLKIDISEIMAPVKDQILRPLQNQRSIRQLSFPVQVGIVDAVSFCLQLEKPVLSTELFTMPLKTSFLVDVINIPDDATFEKLTEADDGLRHKLVENKLIDTDVVEHLAQLRRLSVDLLSNVAVKCAKQLQEPANDELFRRMISIFFKCLQSRDKDLVATAKIGLKQAISQHQKPKETLQRNLRPVLSNLADYKKLSLSYLQGLSRILELLSHWFNVNLGDKLLEHLDHWTEPQKIANLKRGAPGTESTIGAAIIDLFHLLPAAAAKFIDALVYMVLRLECELGVAGPGVAHLGLQGKMAASTSPYRVPLLKFCNKHPEVSIKFFLSKLEVPQIRHLFFVLLRAGDANPLRRTLAAESNALIASTFNLAQRSAAHSHFAFYGVFLINAVYDETRPQWLFTTPNVLSSLLQHWNLKSRIDKLNNQRVVASEFVQENRMLAEILIRFCGNTPDAKSVLFDLLKVFSLRTESDFTFVKDFLTQTVSHSYSTVKKKAILSQFLAFFRNPQVTQERKVHALQLIVIPMIKAHLEELSAKWSSGVNHIVEGEVESSSISKREVGRRSAPGGPAGSEHPIASGTAASVSLMTSSGIPANVSDEVLDAATIHMIVKELLDRPDDILRSYDEPLSAELLQLSTLLIQYMPAQVGGFRKELIKFGWAHLKREDSVAKQWAFVNVSRFFEAYQAPPKIILQVYVALLRAVQGDGKLLVRQALDILTPALPRRLEHNPAEKKCPIWIRYTKKVLLEEGHSVIHLVHIWQLIIRHAGLFYVARSQFVPIMVSTLSRIGLQGSPGSPSAENRRVYLDLADLIISWKADRPYKHVGTVSNVNVTRSTKRRRLEGPASVSSSAGLSSETQPPSVVSGQPKTQSVSASHVGSAAPQGGPGDPSASGAEEFRPSQTVLEITGNFLGQVPFRPMDKRERDIIANRCVVLLDALTQLCPAANVKLTNLEKIVEISDKVPQPNQAALKSRLSQAGQAPGSTPAAAEAKAAAAMKAEAGKIEAQRLERLLVRKAALKAALEMCVVLSRRQCVIFARNNTNTLLALLPPSISDRNVSAAKLFAELLGNLLSHIPSLRSPPKPVPPSKPPGTSTPGSSVASTLMTDVAKAPANALKAKPQPQLTSAATQGQAPKATGNVHVAKSAVQPVASSTVATIDKFYSEMLSTVDRCLRADDSSVTYCGLVVLEVLLAKRPEEFLKFRDVLVKSFTRMVKDNPVISQHPTISANNSIAAQSQKVAASNNARSSLRQEKSAVSAVSSAGNALGARGGAGKTAGASSDESALNSAKTAGRDSTPGSPNDGQTMRLYLSILGHHISSLETGQRRGFTFGMYTLIERCTQVDVLLEIVRVIEAWVTWRSRVQPAPAPGRPAQKDPLTPKDKSQFLLKMVMFERIAGPGSQQLMNSFLDIILTVFGAKSAAERRPELLPKLERAFLLGLKSKNSAVRSKFFKLFDGALTRSPIGRLHYIISRQEWLHLAESFWIKQAAELLVSTIDPKSQLSLEFSCGRIPRVVDVNPGEKSVVKPENDVNMNAGGRSDPNSILRDFVDSVRNVTGSMVATTLRQMLNDDNETAYFTWLAVFPAAWSLTSSSERANLESGLSSLLVKEYHIHQASWSRNVVQALLDGASKCLPPPLIPPEVLFHLGSRWNAWHTALPYLHKRAEWLSSTLKSSTNLDSKSKMRYEDERDSVLNSCAEMYRRLNEKDYFAGVWKRRAMCNSSSEALALEQRGQTAEAQELYSQCMLEYQAMSRGPSTDARVQNGAPSSPQIKKQEVALWEERWVVCAKHLCQWDILTEFSRSVVQSDLMHECLWRVPDWSALKELLYRQPVTDGPTLRFYQAYVHIQENKLEAAENSIVHGYQKALERYCSLPQEAGSDSNLDVFVQFQQLVELQESCRILGELNALSRHGSGGVNVEQKIETVRSILAAWRERLPARHEPLPVWNKILAWRNHVHAVVVNVLETLKDAANAKVAAAQNPNAGNISGGRGAAAQSPSSAAAQVQAAFAIAQSLPQQVLVMGVNETAWNIHRFARACRKQRQPNVAINALLKLYPFGTMELSEYFVKTKETAKSFMEGPSGLENNLEYGLNELNRCNMDHFNARQKAQLFTMKGKFFKRLGKDYNVAESYSTALSISGDVASGWLAWALHCDDLQKRENAGPSDATAAGVSSTDSSQWRESAVNCYLQAVRFGSRKARCYVPRALRLLTEDIIALQKAATARSAALQHNASPVSARTIPSPKPPNVTSSMAVDTSTGTSGSSRTGTGSVVAVFVNFIPILPAWIWLPWLTQIVTMLSRREAIIARAILNRVVSLYPQAVFFPLRAFMEDRKSIDRPSRSLTTEALKSSRANTSALLPAASNAQASNSFRQVHALKEKVRTMQQRLQEKMTEQKTIEAQLQLTKRGTHEYDAVNARLLAAKDQATVMRRNYERACHVLGQAQRKQAQTQQVPSQSQSIMQGLAGTKQEPGASTAASIVSPKTPDGRARPAAPQANISQSVAGAGQSTAPSVQNNISARPSPQQTVPAPRTPYEYADIVMALLVKNHQGLYVDIERVAYSLAKRIKPLQEEQLLHLIIALLHRCYQLPVQPGKEVAPGLITALEDVARMCFGTASPDIPTPKDFKIHPSIVDLKPIFEAELAPQVSKDFPTCTEPFITLLRRWKSIFQRRVYCLGASQNLETLCRHLIEVHGSDVEVFGQYLMAEAVEVSTDSFVKIDKFTADSVVVRRHSGAARGVYVLGNDGKEYKFIIESSTNTTVQPTEERAAQLCRLFNVSFFARHAEAERRRTRIEVPKLIPTGNHTRLVSYDPHTSSLAEGLESYMESRGQTLDDPLMAFRQHASSAFNRRRTQSNSPAGEKIGREGSIAARVEAYHKICQEHVPQTCLFNWISSRIATPNLLFAFQKKFAETLGSSSLICYALAVGARLPQNVTFSWDTGALCNLHVRPLVSPTSGLLECDEAVPFRLTRNIRYFLGPVGLQGPLFGSMAVTMEALRSNLDLLRVYLDTILHDELAVMPKQRSSMNSSNSQTSPVRSEPASPEKRLSVSVENVLRRLDPASALGQNFKKGDISAVAVLSNGVNALIERAGKPENLAEMDSSWQAWY